MRAIHIREYCGPEVLRRVELGIPKPGFGEVLIRVAAACVNFMDVHTREDKYRDSRTYPVRVRSALGMEGAGEVVETGAGVTSLCAGDRVAWCISWGAYADFAVVPAARLAKRRGVEVFATTSTPQKAAIARARGADHVMLYEHGAFADRIRELTRGRGVDVVFDAVGTTTLRDSFRAARVRGLIINYGSVTGPMRDLDPHELGEAGSLFLTRPRLADHLADAATVQRRADDVFAAIRQGALNVEINGRYTLDNVEEAHAALEERRQAGKAVIEIG
ncbi:zinc-binding dehydrogenase [Paraburkholderia atlantica]|uniref:zinc-binding dehydrogenase n=1 Tax=Paraburkholderia atlantica TaxID=2654982 RepID=UPI0016174A87|nr:zinc-binding dehydrogenase [Paraburkholderia atlantica]MBB5510169.1 NADPH2:quinone reductase [Paraburkholderia atlantica]